MASSRICYAKMSPSNAQSSFQKFGNPNLNPETTVAYELGIKTQFSTNDVLTLTAYYKDILIMFPQELHKFSLHVHKSVIYYVC